MKLWWFFSVPADFCCFFTRLPWLDNVLIVSINRFSSNGVRAAWLSFYLFHCNTIWKVMSIQHNNVTSLSYGMHGFRLATLIEIATMQWSSNARKLIFLADIPNRKRVTRIGYTRNGPGRWCGTNCSRCISGNLDIQHDHKRSGTWTRKPMACWFSEIGTFARRIRPFYLYSLFNCSSYDYRYSRGLFPTRYCD